MTAVTTTVQSTVPQAQNPVSHIAPAEAAEVILARLILTLYSCGTPSVTLLEGETRAISSKKALVAFDFWMREPGHLGLALLDSYQVNSAGFSQVQTGLLRDLIARLLHEDAADRHRVPNGVSYSVFSDLDHWLGHLTACALISDRPTFAKGRSARAMPQLTLETTGIAFAQRLLHEAPSMQWYAQQGAVIAACWDLLAQIDLNTMSYLRPDLNPLMAAMQPICPILLKRALAAGFGTTTGA